MSTQGDPGDDFPAAAGEVPSTSKRHPLASRLARLGAAIVDAVLGLAIDFPIMFFTGYLHRLFDETASMGEMALQTLAGMIIFLLLHAYLLATRGQTIGKMLLGIRIVDYNTDQLLSFGKLLGLRLVPVWLVSLVPFAGGCLVLIDTLFIFGNERRCVHDLIAGTKVVEA